MPMDVGAAQSSAAARRPPGTPRRWRRVLSALLLVQWGAVACLILLETAGERALPDPLRPVFAAMAALARPAWPAARTWLDATSTRQHWMLFAPAPSDWAVSVQAVAWYEAPAAALQPDTLPLAGPGADPYPHWSRPRSYDFAFALAYEGAGTFYRATLGRRLCRELERGGRRPRELSLFVVWRPIAPPWEDEPRQPLREAIGRFDCALLLAARPPEPNS